MLGFIITIVLVLVAVCTNIYTYVQTKKDVFTTYLPTAWSCCVIVIFGVLLIVQLVCLTTRKNHFEYIEAKYNNLKAQTEYVAKDNIMMSENLRNQVLEMNNEISEHKCYVDNIWFGMWYSNDVANLEMLKWSEKE